MHEPDRQLQQRPLRVADIDVTRVGDGPPAVLVHGSVVGAERTWQRQLALAERWTLVLPSRPGFGASAELPGGGDFEAEAPAIAELLGAGAHLVGHSYGAVIAIHAAALRPHAVRSLTISEPGCMRVAAGNADVDAQIAAGELLYARAGELQPIDFLRAFRGGVGSTHSTPAELDRELLCGAELLMRERPPWRGEAPLRELRAAPFPTLVISGAHSPVFETICDEVAAQIRARRATVAGRRHTIPAVGDAYNELVEGFWRECEGRAER